MAQASLDLETERITQDLEAERIPRDSEMERKTHTQDSETTIGLTPASHLAPRDSQTVAKTKIILQKNRICASRNYSEIYSL
jgi:hypothetical protein